MKYALLTAAAKRVFIIAVYITVYILSTNKKRKKHHNSTFLYTAAYFKQNWTFSKGGMKTTGYYGKQNKLNPSTKEAKI